MKVINFLKAKKNRYLIIGINALISLLLAILSVYLDEVMGNSALVYIYILEVICIINWIIVFSLVIWNIWVHSKQKLEKRDKGKQL